VIGVSSRQRGFYGVADPWSFARFGQNSLGTGHGDRSTRLCARVSDGGRRRGGRYTDRTL